jgi:hypothetical protein
MLLSLSPASLPKKRDSRRESRIGPALPKPPMLEIGVGHSLGLLDWMDSIKELGRVRPPPPAMATSCRAAANADGPSKDPSRVVSSAAGLASSSSSSSVESLRRPAAIRAAFRIASSMHSCTSTANSILMRSAYSTILLCRKTASILFLATLSVSAQSRARPCSCSSVFVLGDCHCMTWEIRDSDWGDCVLISPGF